MGIKIYGRCFAYISIVAPHFRGGATRLGPGVLCLHKYALREQFGIHLCLRFPNQYLLLKVLFFLRKAAKE